MHRDSWIGAQKKMIFLKLSACEMFFGTQKSSWKGYGLELERIGLTLIGCDLELTTQCLWALGTGRIIRMTLYSARYLLEN